MQLGKTDKDNRQKDRKKQWHTQETVLPERLIKSSKIFKIVFRQFLPVFKSSKICQIAKPTFWSQFYIKSSHIYYKSPNLVTLAGKQTLKTEWQQTPNNNRDMNCFDIKNNFSCPARICTMLVPLQNKNWFFCVF